MSRVLFPAEIARRAAEIDTAQHKRLSRALAKVFYAPPSDARTAQLGAIAWHIVLYRGAAGRNVITSMARRAL